MNGFKMQIGRKMACGKSLIAAGAGFALAMLALAAVCAGAVVDDEKSANYWYEKSQEQYGNELYEDWKHYLCAVEGLCPQAGSL
jgi:hypothetical protein